AGGPDSGGLPVGLAPVVGGMGGADRRRGRLLGRAGRASPRDPGGPERAAGRAPGQPVAFAGGVAAVAVHGGTVLSVLREHHVAAGRRAPLGFLRRRRRVAYVRPADRRRRR